MHTRQSAQQYPQSGNSRREIGRLLLIGSLSGALYLAVYYLQRAIFLNGRMPDVVDVTVGVPASRTQLVWQVAGYGAATLAVFALYVWLLLICRQGGLRDRHTRDLALSLPVV